nr:4Fe-4S dicluster domain-containing protein [Bacilli bacterium]
ANAIALENNIKGKISKIMEASILHLLDYSDFDSILSTRITKEFSKKGDDIVNNNINAIKDISSKLTKVVINSSSNKVRESYKDIIDIINHREGNSLKVSDLIKYKNGCFEGALTKNEKRNVSDMIVKWDSSKCIECGMCSFYCPHGVIRPFISNEGSKDAIGYPDKKYELVISNKDCLGCGVCVSACPVGALSLVNKTDEDNKDVSFDRDNVEVKDRFNVKNSQLVQPKFEFSGACAGCGEAAYIKLLSQLYGNQIVIANATGCSSIYGGSVPSTPYSLPWANSLFEDNAEFAFGINTSFNNKRDRLYNILTNNTYSGELKQLVDELINNYNNYEVTNNIYNKLKVIDNLPDEIKDNLEYIPARYIVALGGDGWAYDIGFNGIDHVLCSNQNIKIMILDTEIYSNTGGQASKSSRVGQVAKFAGEGKKNIKKDLFRIAMTYPNTYVASINMSANPMQAIKSMKEAFEHVGPSIIICYAPCIEHGIKGGMGCSLKEAKKAAEVGYSLLMRYNPDENKLYMDSKEPKFDEYDSFLENEVRYNSLKKVNPDEAQELLEDNKTNSINRYNYYKELSKENE